MNDKVNDIRNAVENNSVLSGLALALTIPDICGKIEYPELNNREAYIQWFNEHVMHYYINSDSKYSKYYEETEFDGSACYGLRCAYLHSGNNDINSKNEFTKITDFSFSISDDIGVYVDRFGVTTDLNSGERINKVRLNIKHFCYRICEAAEKFYNSIENQNVFEKYSINLIDFRER